MDESPIVNNTELPWNEAVLTESINMHGVNGALDISLLPDLYKRRYSHPLIPLIRMGDAACSNRRSEFCVLVISSG